MTPNDAGKRSPRRDRAAARALEKYCADHPGSPAAKHHPRIRWDHGRYIALLGRSIDRGIFGFGSSIASALHSFDDLYRKSHRAR